MNPASDGATEGDDDSDFEQVVNVAHSSPIDSNRRHMIFTGKHNKDRYLPRHYIHAYVTASSQRECVNAWRVLPAQAANFNSLTE